MDVNEIVKNVLAKEKEIYRTTTAGQYFVKGIGYFARVTAVLHAINWDNGSLNKWRNKMALQSFQKQIPVSGTVDAMEAHSAFNKAQGAADEFAKASATFGTQVHSWLEDYALTGKFPEIKQDEYADVFKIFSAVKRFVEDFGIGTDKVTIVKPELFLYHSLGYAGTADLVAIRDNKVYLIDYKSTNSLKQQYLLQLAAYTEALRELYGLDVHKAILIRFSKTDDSYERLALTADELKTYFEMFKMCLMFYRLIQNPTFASVKELNNPDRIAFVKQGILQ